MEKPCLIKKVAKKLMQSFEVNAARTEAALIKEILTHEPINKYDTKIFDKLAKYAN